MHLVEHPALLRFNSLLPSLVVDRLWRRAFAAVGHLRPQWFVKRVALRGREIRLDVSLWYESCIDPVTTSMCCPTISLGIGAAAGPVLIDETR